MKWISAYFLKCYIKSDRLLQGNCEQSLWNQEVDKYVDALPSLDIVTCGECKHRPICCRGKIPMYDNGYCSDGERDSEKPNKFSADAQTYITEDRDTQILDAWQVEQMQTERSE